jgi:hypothetical protein
MMMSLDQIRELVASIDKATLATALQLAFPAHPFAPGNPGAGPLYAGNTSHEQRQRALYILHPDLAFCPCVHWDYEERAPADDDPGFVEGSTTFGSWCVLAFGDDVMMPDMVDVVSLPYGYDKPPLVGPGSTAPGSPPQGGAGKKKAAPRKRAAAKK